MTTKKRIDSGEFINEKIVIAHPYKKGFMVFTEKSVYYVAPKTTKKKPVKK